VAGYCHRLVEGSRGAGTKMGAAVAAAAFGSACSVSMVFTVPWTAVAAAAAFFLVPDDRPRPKPAAH
jgi:hypothetical protein